MLSILVEAEQTLPSLLTSLNGWNSLDVDYLPPRVERLWRPFGEGRLYLHRIHPCSQPFYHPHPWPSAIKVVSGSYFMELGYGSTRSKAAIASSLLLEAGSSYEMSHPKGWHSVNPIYVPSLSIMVTGPVWPFPIEPDAKPDKELQPLQPGVIEELLEEFRQYYPEG